LQHDPEFAKVHNEKSIIKDSMQTGDYIALIWVVILTLIINIEKVQDLVTLIVEFYSQGKNKLTQKEIMLLGVIEKQNFTKFHDIMKSKRTCPFFDSILQKLKTWFLFSLIVFKLNSIACLFHIFFVT